MPSSISSFSKSVNSWGLSWVLVAVICAASLASYELFLKNRGFIASIENNRDLWSWYRGNIQDNQRELVIIGASRSQLGINIPFLKEKLAKYDVTQLSINGQYPMATLKAFASDERFSGTLIVSFNAQALESRYLDMQGERNRYFADKSSFNKSCNAYLSASFQSQFRFLHPLLGMRELVEFYAINKSFKEAFYTTANLDQSVSADYSKTNVDALLKHFVRDKQANYKNEPPTEAEIWAQNIQLIRNYAEAIEARGGHVVLVRFPTNKGHWQLDEQYYPRQQYWDLIGHDSGITTVHFNDVRGLNQIDLPDSTHVDQKDTAEFTEILFDHLVDNDHLN